MKNPHISIYVFLTVGIVATLFIVPFFWLKPGFVDFGGDAGRLFFFDPLLALINLHKNQNPQGATVYSRIPYVFFLYIFKKIITSPTSLIAVEHGLQLSLGFFSIYLIVKELCKFIGFTKKELYTFWIALVSGIVYIGLITKVGWTMAIQTHNQVFLNPLIFYLLFRFLITSRIIYVLALLLLTFIYAGNFGFASMPQLMSFYPLALLFLGGLFRFMYQRPFPWKKLFLLGLLFVGLHAFHLIPTIASVLDQNGVVHSTIFFRQSIQNLGVHYFDVNHQKLGKISLELFQPAQWNGQNILILLVPLIIFLGFLKKSSKLLVLLGVFFAITLLLVSANITSLGVQLYRMLFSIPGFMMFRSFNEKWYFVYSFFYTLLFAVSLYLLTRNKRPMITFLLGICVIGTVGYRIYPFLQGNAVNTTHWQSNNVTGVFTMDPDLLEAIEYVKTLPDDGNVLTLPLTFSYNQIAYGKEGGAYVGVSMVADLGGVKDFPGFWSFGPYQETLFETLRKEDISFLLQLLSFRNIRYIFRNTDPRIIEDFPEYPYVYPGELYYSKDVIPIIKNQTAYTKFLTQMPLKRLFENGFYHIYEIDKTHVRPISYIPDVLYSSFSGALSGLSYRSAFGDAAACQTLESFNLRCDGVLIRGALPDIFFTKESETNYTVRIELKEKKDPFLVILLEDYHSSWEMKLNGSKEGVTHIGINGYANGWIVEPQKIQYDGILKGSIQLGFQKYYTYGMMVSIITGLILIIRIYFAVKNRR